MIKIRKKAQFFSSIIKNNIFHVATSKTITICKTLTFFQEFSFLNPRNQLKLVNLRLLPGRKVSFDLTCKNVFAEL